MGTVPCPDCVVEGIEMPLMIDGECLRSARHSASEADPPSPAMRWWIDTGPLDPLTSAFAPDHR